MSPYSPMPSTRILLATAVLALGCGPKPGATDGTTGDSGGELSPSAVCDAYLQCASVVTPEGLGPLLDTYGPDGTCWESTQDVADQCEIACDSGLEQLRMAYPDEAACGEQADGTAEDTGVDTDSGGGVTERAVDIIVVMDNSGSMGEEQQMLAQGIGGLVGVLDGADPPIDYRFAVTTTDNGNLWCQSTGAESGEFRATSCLGRQTDFIFNGAVTIDVFAEACESQCTLMDLGLSEPWLDVPNATGTGLPADQVSDILSCMLPQGINGCGFESTLESLHRAIQRTETAGESQFGFHRDGALLAVLIVTDEADCSNNPAWETIFSPEGNRVFWSDPDAPAPSSAVCWHAGVACQGSGTYDSCTSVDLDVNANAAATDEDAVLYPIGRYVDELGGRGAFVMAIDGVGADGSVTYADSLSDPEFQSDFGIGPGCESAAGRAVPPVRMHEVIEAVSGPGYESSICAGGFSDGLTAFGEGIVERLPSP